MNTISEILESSFADQGIQDLKVYYDTFVFNLKIKDGLNYNNYVMLEKFSFDYDAETIIREKNSIILNFGNTENPLPFQSAGTCFIDSVLDKSKKVIFLVGIKVMALGNIIPIIYRYDINNHTIKSVFPREADIEQFNSLTLMSLFVEDILPSVKMGDSKLHISFQTNADQLHYIHHISFRILSDTVELDGYDLFEYNENYNLEILDSNLSMVVFRHDDYYGIVSLDVG